MTLERLDSAIHELSEAERLAKTFNWPQETIDRINLLKRGVINLRANTIIALAKRDLGRELENIDRCREADANTYAIEG